MSEEHPCQRKGIELEKGNEVVFNDRVQSLTVVGRHEREQQTVGHRYRGENDHHDVIELVGNGTEYHLLCTGGSTMGPMLYKEADWDEDKTDKYGQSPKYSRGGERIEKMEVV